MDPDADIVRKAAVQRIGQTQELTTEHHRALQATRIASVMVSTVLLEIPDHPTRALIDNSLLTPITEALSHLAKGSVVVMTTVRPPQPTPAPGWLVTAAEALR